jgi:hypothetical protein
MKTVKFLFFSVCLGTISFSQTTSISIEELDRQFSIEGEKANETKDYTKVADLIGEIALSIITNPPANQTYYTKYKSIFAAFSESFIRSNNVNTDAFRIMSYCYLLCQYKEDPDFNLFNKNIVNTVLNNYTESSYINPDMYRALKESSIKLSTQKQIANKPKINCSYSFILPKLNIVTVENCEKICCTCSKQYRYVYKNKSEKEISCEASLNYLNEKLYQHFIATNADVEHIESDKKRLIEYVQNNQICRWTDYMEHQYTSDPRFWFFRDSRPISQSEARNDYEFEKKQNLGALTRKIRKCELSKSCLKCSNSGVRINNCD